jgi:hypothetical protein
MKSGYVTLKQKVHPFSKRSIGHTPEEASKHLQESVDLDKARPADRRQEWSFSDSSLGFGREVAVHSCNQVLECTKPLLSTSLCELRGDEFGRRWAEGSVYIERDNWP